MRKILLMLIACFGLLITCIAQVHPVSGSVKDNGGKPLAGVSVILKGTNIATVTDSLGLFRMDIPVRNNLVASGKLVFSYVGYTSTEIKIGGNIPVHAILSPSTTSMQEVVVVGYGNQLNLEASLSGRVAGVSTQKGSRRDNTRYGNGYHEVDFNTEEYDRIYENRFHKVADEALSTFSIDVDAASYSNIRRFLNNNQLPPADAVRVEEMINYFHYDYAQPKGEVPFSIHTEISGCPWNNTHQLVMIGLQGKKIPTEKLPASNLVFLIDVSGSMATPAKLPLVKSSLKLLVDQLREQDMISIVVYAGNAGLVLPATSGFHKMKIKEAIDNLEAGGSTAGGAGIQLAYKVARQNLVKSGNNRIILCTDGDFNVGVSSNGELERMVEKERESGVFLTVLGYGMGNYKDSKMQILADKGNGNHAYIDSESEAKKVLVTEFGGTVFTIAKDVKLQVEFNPEKVQGYRLIGYENRMLQKEDFKDDKKDAGEMGSGHTVTALYEIIPVGIEDEFLRDVDELKYQKKAKKSRPVSDELLTVKFRYKEPTGSTSQVIEHPVRDHAVPFLNTSINFRFASCVAEFGMLLNDSQFKSNASFQHVLATAESAKGADVEGYRKEFIALVQKAGELKGKHRDITRH